MVRWNSAWTGREREGVSLVVDLVVVSFMVVLVVLVVVILCQEVDLEIFGCL